VSAGRERLGPALMTVYFAAVVLYLFFPILIVAPMSLSDDRFLGFPPKSWGLRWYDAYFSDPVWIDATLRSLRVATVTSLSATVLGTLAIVGLERGRTAMRGPLNLLFAAPVIVPNVIVALGVFIVAIRLGINDQELTLAAAHTALALPFVVMIVGAAYRQIDPTLERAARVLGAGPARAFLSATLPSLVPAIVSAAIFAFFVSFDELIVALFVMGGSETLPVRIWNDLRFEINPTVAAISILFVSVTTVAMTIAELLRRRTLVRAPQ